MRAPAWLFVGLFVACGGNSDTDDTGPTASCDDQLTDEIVDLAPEEWPAGLSESMEPLKTLEGLYTATSCIKDAPDVQIKILDVARAPDDVTVVTRAAPSSVPCGCGSDPNFPANNAMDLVGTFPAYTLTITPDPDHPIDPGVDGQPLLLDGAFFGGTQGLMFRACAIENIAPVLASDNDRLIMNHRIEVNADPGDPMAFQGIQTLDITLDVLEGEPNPWNCTFSNFQKVQ